MPDLQNTQDTTAAAAALLIADHSHDEKFVREVRRRIMAVAREGGKVRFVTDPSCKASEGQQSVIGLSSGIGCAERTWRIDCNRSAGI